MSSVSSKSKKGPNYLPRGSACVSCRRRKMRCDGKRPVCGPCEHASRPEDCEYIGGQGRSTVDALEENVRILEARIQELQSPQANSATVTLYQPYLQAAGAGQSGSSSRDVVQPPSRSSTSTPVQDPPRNVAEALLANFMPYATDFGFFLNLSRFRTSFFQPYPPGHPARPVAPCLIFAVYLWSIRLSPDPNIHAMEDVYLQRAITEAATALSGTGTSTGVNTLNRVMHSIQAEILLATYFFAVGRLLEGKYHVAVAVGTVLSSGLHQIRSSVVEAGNSSTPSSSYLPPSRDPIEEGERILACWTVLNLDQAWAVALDSESNFRHEGSETVDTPWPLEVEGYEQGLLTRNFRASNTVHDFLAGKPTADMSLSSTRAMEAKAVVLWERVASLVTKIGQAQTNLQSRLVEEWKALSVLIEAQLAALLPISSSPSIPASVLYEQKRRILTKQSILNSALIRLYGPFLSNPLCPSRRKRVKAARAVLEGVVGFSVGMGSRKASASGWLNPVIGSTWIEAARVLFDEVVTLRAEGPGSGDERGRELVVLVRQAVDAMLDFTVGIPLMNVQVQSIQELFGAV